jgi:hypothetical protein
MAMKIPILLEPIAGNGYRAKGGEPFGVVVEAATREEALSQMKERLEARLRNGAEIVDLEVVPGEHPLREFVGMFKDDPMIAEWKKAMAGHKQKIDNKPRLP